MKAKVIFIFGPVASGKLTVARTLRELTGARLFHNHLTVDLLLAVFPFGSPEFVRLREHIWTEVMLDAVRTGTNVIFTFAPEKTVSREFVPRLTNQIIEAGGAISFVELKCQEETIERRLGESSRFEFGKLTSVEEYRALRASGAFEYSSMPCDFVIETESVSAHDAAVQLLDKLGEIEKRT